MTNLAIAALCNQACPYCFTADHRRQNTPVPDFVALADMGQRLDYLERSGIREVRLMGGEPTLHPAFVEIVERARGDGFKVVVFSNGLMPARALTCLAALPPEACTVMVNVNDPARDGEERHARRLETLRRLGERAILGCNIHRADMDLGYLLPAIAGSGCRPVIRLGMAQPCLSGDNEYIHPNQYVAIGTRIARFAGEAALAGVRIEFDCGFVRCMFSDRDLAIFAEARADVGWRCNPILDIDTAGRVIHCYPLSDLGSLPLTPEGDAATLRQAWAARVGPYRQAGVFRECSACPFKASGECPGGCLAVTIRRFRRTPFRFVVPGQEVAQCAHG